MLEKGVPWEIAAKDGVLRDALTLIFAEKNGSKFNWETQSFYTDS